jgi:hypothetical protein
MLEDADEKGFGYLKCPEMPTDGMVQTVHTLFRGRRRLHGFYPFQNVG